MGEKKLATTSSAFSLAFTICAIGQKAVFYLLLCHFWLVLGNGLDQEQAKIGRFKRQYSYDDGYYGNYYGWQAGRLVGWMLGFFCLMLILCIPCVCCIGIWFAGWFGLRQAMARRQRNQGLPPPGAAIVRQHERSREVRVDPPSPLAVPVAADRRSAVGANGADQRFVYSESSDRYYERRRSPPIQQRNHSSDSYYGRETRRL